MIGEGTKRFDLYDFFSVFLPGAAFTLGVAPLFPVQFIDELYFLVGIVLIGGFVTGRWFHAFSMMLEVIGPSQSHRELFEQELKDPDLVAEEVVDEFYSECQKSYGDALPESRPGTEAFEDVDRTPSSVCDTLYTMVRSAIHMDSRGRSRTFQAILDFYRGIWAVSVTLALIYFLYAAYLPYGVAGAYDSVLIASDVSPDAISMGAFILTLGSFQVFGNVRGHYRDLYIEYLIVDYLNIHADS